MVESKKYDAGGIYTISFAHLLHDIYSSFLAPLLPLLIAKLGFSYSQAGFLSFFSRLPSLMNPLIGVLADKMALRYFVIAAPALTCVSMSLLGVAPNYYVLAVLLFLMGVSAAFFHVPAPVMIRRVAGDRVGKAMSFFMLGGESARSLGPLIILGAVSLWGLEGTWRLIPFGLAGSLFFYFKLRHIADGPAPVQHKQSKGIRSTFRHYLPFLSVIAGISGSRSLMKAALTLFLPAYLTFKGQSVWFSGIALSVLEFTGALGTLYFGSISDKIGRRTSLLIISALSPVFMFLLIFIDGFFTIPILLLTGFSLLAPTPVLLAAVQEVAVERPAFVNGMFMTMNFVIGALAAVVVGMLSDHFGLEHTYIFSGCIALAAIPFSLFIREIRKE